MLDGIYVFTQSKLLNCIDSKYICTGKTIQQMLFYNTKVLELPCFCLLKHDIFVKDLLCFSCFIFPTRLQHLNNFRRLGK